MAVAFHTGYDDKTDTGTIKILRYFSWKNKLAKNETCTAERHKNLNNQINKNKSRNGKLSGVETTKAKAERIGL